MKKRLQSITARGFESGILLLILLLIWQGTALSGLVRGYLLPSPAAVLRALVGGAPELMGHAGISLTEAFLGLLIGTGCACLLAVLMDEYAFLYRSVYPLLIVSQTVPPIAIAPLLLLWLGYGIAPKIALVVIVCFFPVAVGLLDGLKGVDTDQINLLRTMGASRAQIFWHVRLPGALPGFFSGFKIAASYSIVGAVIAEWLGGDRGLGVYMTRVRKSYAFDKMFAVIFLISLLSLLLIKLVERLEKRVLHWKYRQIQE